MRPSLKHSAKPTAVGAAGKNGYAVYTAFLTVFLICQAACHSVVAPAIGQSVGCTELQKSYERDLQEPHKEIENYHLANLLRLGDLEVFCNQDKKAGLINALSWYVKADSFYAANAAALGQEVDHDKNVVSILFYTQGLIALGDTVKMGTSREVTQLLQNFASLHKEELAKYKEALDKYLSRGTVSASDSVAFHLYDYAKKIAVNPIRWDCKFGDGAEDSRYDRTFKFVALLAAYKESLVTKVDVVPEWVTDNLHIQPKDLVHAFKIHAEKKKFINSAYMAGGASLERARSDSNFSYMDIVDSVISYFGTVLKTLNTGDGIPDRVPPFLYFPESFDRRLADDMQYEIGDMRKEKGKTREAQLAFAKVLRFHLGSDHVREASRKLSEP